MEFELYFQHLIVVLCSGNASNYKLNDTFYFDFVVI